MHVARYYFNVIDGKLLVDNEGTECSDMVEVRVQAIETAGAILRDLAVAWPNGVEWQMHVTDESRSTVFRLRFSAEEPH